MKITVDKNISYQLQKGVVLKDQFLNKQDFAEAFRAMLRDSDGYSNLRYNLSNARKIISILQKGSNKIETITEFTSDLEKISELFSAFMMGLGGDISLLTTFNMGKKSSSIYFLQNEKDLPSQINGAGEKTYYNTLKTLQDVQLGAGKLKKLNDALKSHLNGFYRQLISSNTQSIDDYERMKVWSYYNMPQRYKSFEKNDGHYPVSIGRYFWGRGHIHGYSAEAFGAHLALVHPNALVGQHIDKLKRSVISEHGGPGSFDLFNLLASTKGNTSSQLSGDIVVVDGQGRVQFNIQSKASKYGTYEFTITYQKFLQSMILFLDIYEKYSANQTQIEAADIDALFNAFSTKAWVPISQELAENIDKEVEDLVLKKILK